MKIPLQNPSTPIQIPRRPRKIRKFSPDSTKSPKIEFDKSPEVTTTATTMSLTSKPALSPQLETIPRTISRSLSCKGEVETALRHLRAADPLLAAPIDLYRPPTFDSFHPPFHALAKSILYQQLATKAATTIYNRFVSLCGGEVAVLPDTVISLTPQQLRLIGVSSRKASYLHDLSSKYQNGNLSDSSILEMDDKSLSTNLIMVKGIGPWSVHMFMIFSLHRPDVLPVSDLGVRKGVQKLYGLKELPTPSLMEQLCEKWKPYRSVAAWYMWRLVESQGAPPSSTVVVEAGNTSLQQG